MTEERVELDPHPIRDLVARTLKDGVDEPASLDAEGLKVIAEAVEIYRKQSDRELHEVIRTMIAIFEWLRDEQKSPKAAEAFKSTFKTPAVIERINEIEAEMKSEEQAALREGTEKNAQAFSKLEGRDGKTAPKVGDNAAAPKGAIKLGDMSFPKKL